MRKPTGAVIGALAIIATSIGLGMEARSRAESVARENAAIIRARKHIEAQQGEVPQ